MSFTYVERVAYKLTFGLSLSFELIPKDTPGYADLKLHVRH
jgi:hypothetical protein